MLLLQTRQCNLAQLCQVDLDGFSGFPQISNQSNPVTEFVQCLTSYGVDDQETTLCVGSRIRASLESIATSKHVAWLRPYVPHTENFKMVFLPHLCSPQTRRRRVPKPFGKLTNDRKPSPQLAEQHSAVRGRREDFDSISMDLQDIPTSGLTYWLVDH